MAIEKCYTAFKPSKHGFHFKNNFIGPFQYLCGGMVWSALDRFFCMKAIPDNIIAPDPYAEILNIIEEGTQQWPDIMPPEDANLKLYYEILKRQVDYLRGTSLVAKLLDWMDRPNKGHLLDTDHSIGYLVQKYEWPSVKEILKAGFPETITLVTRRTKQLTDFISDLINLSIFPVEIPPLFDLLQIFGSAGGITENHDVLATGFQIDDSTAQVTINIYDPNYPNDDNVTISIMLGQEDSNLSAKHSKGTNLRGFFHWPYDRRQVLITEKMLEARKEREENDEMNWWILMQ